MAPLFEPHAVCYAGDKAIIWSFVISDFLIGVSYMMISTRLLWVCVKHRVPWRWLLFAFFLFINLCGWTHFWHVIGIFHPDFVSGAILNIATAVVSGVVAVLVVIHEFDAGQIEEKIETDKRRIRDFYFDLKQTHELTRALGNATLQRAEEMLRKTA